MTVTCYHCKAENQAIGTHFICANCFMPQETEYIIPTVKPPTYECDICGKMLLTPLALAGHKRSHL